MKFDNKQLVVVLMSIKILNIKFLYFNFNYSVFEVLRSKQFEIIDSGFSYDYFIDTFYTHKMENISNTSNKCSQCNKFTLFLKSIECPILFVLRFIILEFSTYVTPKNCKNIIN